MEKIVEVPLIGIRRGLLAKALALNTPSSFSSVPHAAAGELVEDDRDAFVDRLLAGGKHEFRIGWGLIGIVDASEAFQLAGPGLLVESLRVALLADIKRCVHVAFEE